MLQLRRAEARTRSHLFRQELGESMDHLMRAAGHVAGGARATMEPRLYAAREYVGPAADRLRESATTRWGSTAAAFNQAAESAAKQARTKEKTVKAARKKRGRASGRRYTVLIGLLATGAAAGAAGALLMRRRRQRWEEYDPTRALETVEESRYAEAGQSEPRATGMIPDEARDRQPQPPGSAATTEGGASASATESAEELVSRARDAARNSRG